MKAKKKLITFYHIKDYIESGAVKMEGVIYEYVNSTMMGLRYDGKKMMPYLFFKGEYAFTKKEAVLLGNKIIMEEINYHKKQISKLNRKLK